MLKAVELPAGITNLDTSLADVDGDALTLWNEKIAIDGKILGDLEDCGETPWVCRRPLRRGQLAGSPNSWHKDRFHNIN